MSIKGCFTKILNWIKLSCLLYYSAFQLQENTIINSRNFLYSHPSALTPTSLWPTLAHIILLSALPTTNFLATIYRHLIIGQVPLQSSCPSTTPQPTTPTPSPLFLPLSLLINLAHTIFNLHNISRNKFPLRRRIANHIWNRTMLTHVNYKRHDKSLTHTKCLYESTTYTQPRIPRFSDEPIENSIAMVSWKDVTD